MAQTFLLHNVMTVCLILCVLSFADNIAMTNDDFYFCLMEHRVVQSLGKSTMKSTRAIFSSEKSR